ncbi:MAG: hypothetical protein Q6351_003880 [Candidatus Njordarchaeum guaymaensis]
MAIRKIAIMTAWNVDSGVFIHAEPIVKEWIKMGYDVKVFTFIREDFHGRVIFGKDEPYVTRCFGTSGKTNFLDPRPLLTEDYDVLVIEDLKMLPMKNLAKIFPMIRKKTKAIVHVFHENTILGEKPPQPPEFYAFTWDAVVYFEKKQEWYTRKLFGDLAHYIPFPCFPIRKGDKEKARAELGLPTDKKIVLVFAKGGYKPYLPRLPNNKLKDVYFLILTTTPLGWKYPQVHIRPEPPLSNEKLDQFAFAADAIILHKIRTPPYPVAVTSSATYQLLGTLRPLLAPRISEFFEPFQDVILKYSDRDELAELLVDALTMGEKTKKVLKNAESFVMGHSPEKIARMYIELFEKIV